MVMANKSTSKDCSGIELSTHKVITMYSLAVATVAIAVSVVALRYAVMAGKEADDLRKIQAYKSSLEAYYEKEAEADAEAAVESTSTEQTDPAESTEATAEESAE